MHIPSPKFSAVILVLNHGPSDFSGNSKRAFNKESKSEVHDSHDVAIDRQPSDSATNVDRPTKPVQSVNPRPIARIPKPQVSKPVKSKVVEEPDVVETEPLELEQLEQEPDNDRASVAPSDGRARRSRGTGRSQAATYDCLPNTVPRDVFKDIYIPTVTKYLAKLLNAWSTSTTSYIHVIQSVWDEVFPKAPYKFELYGPRCDIIRLVSCKHSAFDFKLSHTYLLCRSLSAHMSGAESLHPPPSKPYLT